MITCQQKPICTNPAAFRFTWPGNDESYCCAMHAEALKRVAEAIGLHLQFIPVTFKGDTNEPK